MEDNEEIRTYRPEENTKDRAFTFDDLKAAWLGGVQYGKAIETGPEGVEMSCPDFYSWYHLTFDQGTNK